VEFAEHREYVPGDDVRFVDWKVYGKSDRYYIKQYEEETNLRAWILLDCSESMEYGAPGGMTKIDYGRHVAAALAYLITQQQDAVGLGIVGETLQTFLPARARRTHLAQLLGLLAAVTPGGATGLARGIEEALAQIPHRGLIVLISDLLTDTDEVLESLHRIRFRGHDLIVLHVLDAAETQFRFEGAVALEDPETGRTLVAEAAAVRQRYLEALARWRGQLDQQITALRGDYVPLDTAMPFDKALVEFLIQRQRRR
jgi:uncharacterized protein (DUF58 family)